MVTISGEPVYHIIKRTYLLRKYFPKKHGCLLHFRAFILYRRKKHAESRIIRKKAPLHPCRGTESRLYQILQIQSRCAMICRKSFARRYHYSHRKAKCSHTETAWEQNRLFTFTNAAGGVKTKSSHANSMGAKSAAGTARLV